MKQNKNEIEMDLRSEKTRRFLMDTPPKLVRIGTIVISFIVLLMASAMFFIKYDGIPLWRLFL